MKRKFHSLSPPSPSSPLSISELSDELESGPKRSRVFVSSPTPPPDDDTEIEVEEEEDEEIIIDDPVNSSATITENSENEYNIDDDDDVIALEQQNSNLPAQPSANVIVVVSDSDSDDMNDDLGIDVTDDIPRSIYSIINASISSPDVVDLEAVQEIYEELLSMNEENNHERLNNEDDHESLEIVHHNRDDRSELIDLTEDEPIVISCSPIPLERKLSIDVQQCPICLETLSHLQRSGVYLIITQCCHVMCTLCSRQLLATSSRCPLCRENVSSTTLMPYCILT